MTPMKKLDDVRVLLEILAALLTLSAQPQLLSVAVLLLLVAIFLAFRPKKSIAKSREVSPIKEDGDCAGVYTSTSGIRAK